MADGCEIEKIMKFYIKELDFKNTKQTNVYI
jgi:hypothetical protein